MPYVNKDELINQMREVAGKLDQHDGSSQLGELISSWADCVEELCEQTALQSTLNEAVEAGEALADTLRRAAGAASAFHPIDGRPPSYKPKPSTVFSGGVEYDADSHDADSHSDGK